MLEEKMTVGPKGQVVIPSPLRKAFKILPGSKVVFRIEKNKIILERLETDSVSTFRVIARKGKSIRKILPREYEAEISKRTEL